MQGLEPGSEEDVEPAEPEFELQTPRQPGWAETHDIDVDSPMTSAEEKEFDARANRIDHDPLNTNAKSYLSDVHEVLRPFGRERSEARLSDLTEAIHDVYSWSLTIAAKSHRAVSSLEFAKDEDTGEADDDPVQNDANGSAKVVLLAIEQSVAAWSTIAQAGVLDPGLANYLVDELTTLGSELRQRFPFAMAFVRPGFDEEIPGVVRPWSVNPSEEEEDEDDE
jgi:hypothetical protein